MARLEIILNFISIYPPNLLFRFIKKSLAFDCIIVLDLEDTLQDLVHPWKTKNIKNIGRSNLIELAKLHPELFQCQRMGIRINKLQDAEFQQDLKLLESISKIGPLRCILCPKVESPNDLLEYQNNFKKHGIRYELLIPIVETVKGMKNLQSIALSVPRNQIYYIMYGHFDYSLDAKQWPFLVQNQIKFWEIVIPFISIVESSHVQYIHTPISEMSNERIEQIYLRLKKLCRLPFGMISLNTMQASICHRFFKEPAPERPELFLQEDEHDLRTKIDLARDIQQRFENSHVRKSFLSKYNQFIPPHMYQAAIQFLEKNNAL